MTHVVEELDGRRALVVTGGWSGDLGATMRAEGVDGLVLNYARGFSDPDPGLLATAGGQMSRIKLLDRSVQDLRPDRGAPAAVTDLSIQAAEAARIDLGASPSLTALAGPWALLSGSITAVVRTRTSSGSCGRESGRRQPTARVRR